MRVLHADLQCRLCRSAQRSLARRKRLCSSTMAQAVQLQVAAASGEVLDAFKAQFRPAEGVQVELSYAGGPPAPLSGRPPNEHPWFDSHTYLQALRPGSGMGRLVMATPEVGSTQEFMRAHAPRLPPGSVLVAQRQTSGRGRGNNQWTSPPGCLMFSAAREVRVPGAQAPFVNYVVCLAVVRGIRQEAALHLPRGVTPDVRIKWPNDLLSGGAKIGGALIHTSWRSDRFSALVGVGLNVRNTHPSTCLEAVLLEAVRGAQAASDSAALAEAGAAGESQKCESPPSISVSPERLLAFILGHLDEAFSEFERNGFAPLEADYLEAWLHSGQRVELEEAASGQLGRDAAAGGAGRVALTIRGLSAGGFLLASDEWGGRYELTPDGNSLDMMQGLIRRKLL